jgi:urea transport system ATP-binding protein
MSVVIRSVSPSIVELKNVVVSFQGFTALDVKSFYVDRKELRFLIGPNGAGKTTLLDAICRKVTPRSGSIVFDGWIELNQFSVSAVARLGIARKFQAPSVFANLSVRQNMELAFPRAMSVFSGLGFRLGREESEEIDEVLELIGLMPHARERAADLSHGQKQWLELGLTILQRPKLLLVDEPVAGMSAGERRRTGEILTRVARDRAVLVVEHDMRFVESFSHAVSVLHEGRILCEGSFEEVSQRREVVDVYLGRGRTA